MQEGYVCETETRKGPDITSIAFLDSSFSFSSSCSMFQKRFLMCSSIG